MAQVGGQVAVAAHLTSASECPPIAWGRFCLSAVKTQLLSRNKSLSHPLSPAVNPPSDLHACFGVTPPNHVAQPCWAVAL